MHGLPSAMANGALKPIITDRLAKSAEHFLQCLGSSANNDFSSLPVSTRIHGANETAR
jgi:hypothetical protein